MGCVAADSVVVLMAPYDNNQSTYSEAKRQRAAAFVSGDVVPAWLLADIEEALQASRVGNVFKASDVFADIRTDEEDV